MPRSRSPGMLFAEWDLMGLSGSEVASVVYEPEVLRPNRLGHHEGCRIAVGRRLAVVFNPSSQTAVSVLWRGATWRDGHGRPAGARLAS